MWADHIEDIKSKHEHCRTGKSIAAVLSFAGAWSLGSVQGVPRHGRLLLFIACTLCTVFRGGLSRTR